MAIYVGMVEILVGIGRFLANSRGSTDDFVLLLQRPLKNAAAAAACRARECTMVGGLSKVAMCMYLFICI